MANNNVVFHGTLACNTEKYSNDYDPTRILTDIIDIIHHPEWDLSASSMQIGPVGIALIGEISHYYKCDANSVVIRGRRECGLTYSPHYECDAETFFSMEEIPWKKRKYTHNECFIRNTKVQYVWIDEGFVWEVEDDPRWDIAFNKLEKILNKHNIPIIYIDIYGIEYGITDITA